MQALYTQHWIGFIVCSDIFVEENFRVTKTLKILLIVSSFSGYFSELCCWVSCWNFVVKSASCWSFVVVETSFLIENFIFKASETSSWEVLLVTEVFVFAWEWLLQRWLLCRNSLLRIVVNAFLLYMISSSWFIDFWLNQSHIRMPECRRKILLLELLSLNKLNMNRIDCMKMLC